MGQHLKDTGNGKLATPIPAEEWPRQAEGFLERITGQLEGLMVRAASDPNAGPDVTERLTSLILKFKTARSQLVEPLGKVRMDNREVVRCEHCTLVQFRTSNSLCRRCHKYLETDEPILTTTRSIKVEEGQEHVTGLANSLLNCAIANLPPDQAERYKEEWEADLMESEGIRRFARLIGMCWAGWRIRRAARDRFRYWV